jgi:hypothetical protein
MMQCSQSGCCQRVLLHCVLTCKLEGLCLLCYLPAALHCERLQPVALRAGPLDSERI